jgi:hypothetical protein
MIARLEVNIGVHLELLATSLCQLSPSLLSSLLPGLSAQFREFVTLNEHIHRFAPHVVPKSKF